MLINIDGDLFKELIALGDRLTEDRLYGITVQEVEKDIFDGLTKAKALEEAEGDGRKARSFYPKHRVRRIRDLISGQALLAEAERVKAKKDRLKVLVINLYNLHLQPELCNDKLHVEESCQPLWDTAAG